MSLEKKLEMYLLEQRAKEAHASPEMEILQWDFFKFSERNTHLKSAVIGKHRKI